MIANQNPNQMKIVDFALPFSGRLNSENKWIILADLVPWDELTKRYTKKMSKNLGRKAINPHIAIGALIIKHFKKLVDEDTIQEIQENPYLQYFLGFHSYQFSPCFDPSLFVTIHKRLKAGDIEAINEVFITTLSRYKASQKEKADSTKRGPEKKDDNNQNTGPGNRGKMIVDATVAPANIKYPTDIDLLNSSREISEEIINAFHAAGLYEEKPRTYCRIARRNYLRIIKKKRKSGKIVRRGIRQQLQYLRRNLANIEKVIEADASNLDQLPRQLADKLPVIQKIYQQQNEMYQNHSNRADERIVSVHQPWVRPITRGKAHANVEFGAKIIVSVVDGFVHLDRYRWNAFNESVDLIDQINKYHRRYGYYPAVVMGDGIYGTRKNRQFMKERGIRFSGKKLGRPPKELTALMAEEERLRKLEQGERNEVEGKFGTAKTKYGMDRIMAKLEETSGTWIAMAIFSLNLATALRRLLFFYFFQIVFRLKMTIISDLNLNKKWFLCQC